MLSFLLKQAVILKRRISVKKIILIACVIFLGPQTYVHAVETERGALVQEVIQYIESGSLYASSLSEADYVSMRACMNASTDRDFVKACFIQDKYARYVWPEKFEKIISGSSKITWEKTGDDVFYIRIDSFAHKTCEEDVAHALNVFSDSGTAKLVIDLRANPGGRMKCALFMLHMFAPKPMVEILVEDYEPLRITPIMHIAFKKGDYAYANIAVLVDGYSASAAEIVAGVLRHWGAAIVGEKTFGKGTKLQSVLLSDGSILFLSYARLRLPEYGYFEGRGIMPTIPTEPRFALERALEYFEHK